MSITTNLPEVINPPVDSLSAGVKESVTQYLATLGEQEPRDVYKLFLQQIEIPLIQMTFNRNRGNESETAKQLGIARGTLRKLRKIYKIERQR